MYVKSITLENVRCFEHLHFDFQRPDGSYAGWTTIVGGNTSGKSTVLKAISLASIDITNSIFHQFARSGQWIKHSRDEGKINLFVSESATANTVVFKRDKVSAVYSYNNPEYYPMAYGPMRRLSGSSSESLNLMSESSEARRFLTLFREDAALSESEAWFKTNYFRFLESQDEKYKYLIESVKALLNDGLLPRGLKITRITVDHVYVADSESLELPMSEMSDGCRSIYAMILDIIRGMFDKYGIEGLFSTDSQNRPIVNCPGVVLIDEIEAHLHPTWQRDIPEWLKVHFPKVQFLVTTHSPLVVQAVDPGGVFVLPSAGDSNQTPRQLNEAEIEKLRLGRAEKTLLGIAFGLKSTRSSWAEKQIERWKRLNAKRRVKELSPEEETEYQALHQQMNLAFEANAPETC